MKSKEEILEAIKLKTTWQRGSNDFIEARDYKRLTAFFPVDQWGILGFDLKGDAEAPEIEDWNEENIIKHLKSDLQFAIGKAKNARGISSSLMFEVINMWLWILENPLYTEHYNDYGLSHYMRVKEKYPKA